MAISVDNFYRRYGPMVYRRCQRLLRDDEQAADAMQDVFVQLLQHHDRLDDRGSSSLLYRIATNVCLNRLRTRSRRPEDPESARIQDFVARCDHSLEARSILERLLGPSPASTTTIAVLHYLDGLTLGQVAEVVGMSESGVRKRLRNLRTELQRLEASP